MDDQLKNALDYLVDANDFYNQVMRSSESERIAVGQDHHDWIRRAVNDVTTIYSKTLKLEGLEHFND